MSLVDGEEGQVLETAPCEFSFILAKSQYSYCIDGSWSMKSECRTSYEIADDRLRRR